MVLQNFCTECGKRIYPNQSKCSNCGAITVYKDNDKEYIIDLPVYDVGFFNTQIDFSFAIKSYRKEYKYVICKCGYINAVDNNFCSVCGNKLKGKLSKIINVGPTLPKSPNKIICDNCNTENLIGSKFCENCGHQLIEERNTLNPKIKDDGKLDNLKFNYADSVFCYCGAENGPDDKFCGNCGLPLEKIDSSKDYKIYCSCGKINDAKNEYCENCGQNLSYPHKNLVCVCGTINPVGCELCSNCNRLLTEDRYTTTKLICKCGAILDYQTSFCPFCGSKIAKDINKIRSLSKHIYKIKSIFR